MNKIYRSLLVALGSIFVGFGVFSLSPGEMSALSRVVSLRNPGDVIIELETESEWDPPLVSLLLSSGEEVYIQVDGGILESRRAGLDREDRSAREELQAGRFIPLNEVYPVILQDLSTSRNYSFINADNFYSIGFDREYGRVLVVLEFRANPSAWSLGDVDSLSSASPNWDSDERASVSTWPTQVREVKVYADPTDGSIVSVESDD